MNKETARVWLDKAEALIKEDFKIKGSSSNVEYKYEGSVAQLLEWTTTAKGYADIMNGLNPVFKVDGPIYERVTFRPENRKHDGLFSLLLNVYDHAKLIRIDVTRVLISHDYPSTIVKHNEIKRELMYNLHDTGLSAHIAMTPITPYAHAGNGIISVFAPIGIVDKYLSLFGNADVDFEEAAAINRYSTEVMLAITLAGYKDRLNLVKVILPFHEASAEKHGFRNVYSQSQYSIGAR